MFILDEAVNNLSVGDIIQIIIGSITAIGLIITGLTFVFSIYTNRKQYEYNKKKKAIELSEIYAKLISDDISELLRPYYEDQNISALINECYSIDNNAAFDYYSLTERCNDPKLIKYKDAKGIYNELFNRVCFYFKGKILEKQNTLSGKALTDEINKKYIEYNNLYSVVLNKIEAYSMYFVTGIADEEVAFPSIHQVFLKFVKVSSIRIANANITSFYDYYKYTITLYNDWSKKQKAYSEKRKKEKFNPNDVKKTCFK